MSNGAEGPAFDLQPTPEEPSQKAGTGGWVALLLILALLIGTQLYDYLTRKPTAGSQYTEIVQTYRMHVILQEVGRRYPVFKQPGESAAGLDDAVAQVVEERKKDPQAARLYVSMRHEQGKEILPEDLQILRESSGNDAKAFATIYGAKSLPKEEAERLGKALPDNRFTYRMARIHALEKAGDKTVRQRSFTGTELAGPLVFSFAAMGSLLLGILLLTGYGFARAAGKLAPRGHPAGELNSVQANAYAGSAALFFFLWLAIGTGAAFLLKGLGLTEHWGVLAEVVLVVVVFAYLARQRGPGPNSKIIGGGQGRFWGDVAWGVGGFFANLPLVACCAIAGNYLFSGLPDPEHPVTVQLVSDQSLPTVLMMLVLAAVLAPLFEEITFRGVILPAFGHLFGGPFMGILATSLAFAAIHPTGIPVWPALAMVGATASMLVYQRGSLIPSIVFHGLHNLSLTLMLLLVF